MSLLIYSIIAFFATLIIFVGSGFLIQAISRIPFYWVSVPANTFALIVTTDNRTGEASEGGGTVVDVLHAIPGVRLVKDSHNPMDWHFEEGEEVRGFLFRWLGVQTMGLYRTVRTNLDKRLRFTRGVDEENYTVKPKDKLAPFVFYSGELNVRVENADTKGSFELDFDFNTIFKRKFPVRSVLMVADASAYTTSVVEEVVNSTTGDHPPEDYLGGTGSKDEPAVKTTEQNKKELTQKVKDISEDLLEDLGMELIEVNIRSVDMSREHRLFVELKTKTERQAEAAMIEERNAADRLRVRAQAEKDARILSNDAEADHIERVIIPLAENHLRVEVRKAESYENNKTVTVFAPGGNVAPVVQPQ